MRLALSALTLLGSGCIELEKMDRGTDTSSATPGDVGIDQAPWGCHPVFTPAVIDVGNRLPGVYSESASYSLDPSRCGPEGTVYGMMMSEFFAGESIAPCEWMSDFGTEMRVGGAENNISFCFEVLDQPASMSEAWGCMAEIRSPETGELAGVSTVRVCMGQGCQFGGDPL